MNTYRVFVTRHYIAVDFYDIEAETPAKARNAARSTANKLRPDARSKATDNGWIPDDPVTIMYLGASSVPFTPVIVNTLKNGTKVYHYTEE